MASAASRIAQGALPDWCKTWFICAFLAYGLIVTMALYTFNSVICALLPCVCFIQLLLTVGVCYALFLPRIAGTSIVFPAISELGIYTPEKFAYQLGFGMVGLMLLATIHVFDKKVSPQLLEALSEASSRQLVVEAVNYGYYAAFGVILQGICTLNTTMSPEVALHFVGAFVFCSYGMHHCNSVRQLFEAGLSAEHQTLFFSHPYIRRTVEVRTVCLDKFPLLFVLVPIMFQAYQVLFKGGAQLGGNANLQNQTQGNVDAGGGTETAAQEENPTLKNIMGLVQWLIILQVAVYFCTYAVDFWVVGIVTDSNNNKSS